MFFVFFFFYGPFGVPELKCTYLLTYLLISLRVLCRPAKSTGLPSRLLVFLTPSTGLLGGRTFLLVLKK